MILILRFIEDLIPVIFSDRNLVFKVRKRAKIRNQDQSSLNADQKYCRMLQGEEHSAILLSFIRPPFVIKIFVLSILSGHFTQVFTVHALTLVNWRPFSESYLC